MTITVDVWQMIYAIGSVIAAIGMGFLMLGKVLLAQIQANLEHDSAKVAKVELTAQRVERDLMKLRAQLPLEYVRREDYIRGQTVIEAKLDAISSELKLVQIQGVKRAAS